jgi:hypothetical protein
MLIRQSGAFAKHMGASICGAGETVRFASMPVQDEVRMKGSTPPGFTTPVGRNRVKLLA